MSNPAGWNCDICRKSGLEIKRRCGWLPKALETAPHTIWRRKRVSVDTCPKSLITAQSITWIEAFLTWKRLRLRLSFASAARDVQAFLILEELLTEEHSAL